MDISLFHTETTQPLARWGVEHTLLALDTHTLLYTWVALGIIFLLALLGRWSLKHQTSASYVITMTAMKGLKSLIEQSVPFKQNYYFFIGSLFFFIFICNALVLIPGLEEPTGNLNTTFALAIISFFYVQKETAKAHGLLGYLNEYFKVPIKVSRPHTTLEILLFIVKIIANIIIALLAFPLEALSKVATILSLSLRLFGNIFGSSIIMGLFRQFASGTQFAKIGLLLSQYNIALSVLAMPLMVAFAAVLSLALNFAFGLIESLIQAFVFAILTLTYISLAIQHEHSHQSTLKEHRA